MIDEQVAEFLKSNIERVYPGQWNDFAPGFGLAYIETNGVGIRILYDKVISLGAGVLADLSLSEELIREVADVTARTSFGNLAISEGQPGNWIVTFAYKVLPTWIDPQSHSSAKLLLDVLSNFPAIVESRADHLQQQFGGTRWTTDEGWWMALMDHC